jgi:hypothetical protein
MVDNMGTILAQLKIEETRRSVTPILDYDAQIVPEQPRLMAQQVGRVLQAMGSRITALGEHVSQERDIAPVTSLREQQDGILG